jgi:hypothetical protein
MTLLEAITEANLLATGKATAPSNTSSRYLALKGFSNVVQRMWQDEPDVQWDSLKITVTLAAVVTATDTFSIGSSVREISQRDGDYIHIVHTDGVTITYYELVEPDQLQEYKRNSMQAVARVGANLVFAIEFTADSPQLSGAIRVPCYTYVSTLSDDSDIIQVDNPTWVTLMMAAEYCRTKTSLVGRVDGLVARAGEIMQKMKQQQDSDNVEVQRESIGISRTW